MVPGKSSRPLKTYPLKSRLSKVHVRDFAKPSYPPSTLDRFINDLPDILAAKDFKEFLTILQRARAKKRAIIFGLGAHVIKVGLNPILIDLMKRGWITALAMNGAGTIHDFEIALSGQTSEDVASQLKQGRFGMAQETGKFLNEAVNAGARMDLGLGEAVGQMIAQSRFPYKKYSLLGSAWRLGIPATVHVALGTDTTHFHPQASGEAIGKTSLKDFFRLSCELEDLEGGGVFINVGSAVILPEVFLKAVSLVRNRGFRLENFSTAVFDFIHHYRPDQNVVRRPLGKKGRGFYFIGHHEIMIPLLAAALKSRSS